MARPSVCPSWLILLLAPLALVPGSESAARIELVTGDPCQVVRPGQEAQVGLRLINPGARDLATTCAITVESFDGSRVQSSAQVTVPARGERRQTLPDGTFATRGIKWVRARLAAEDNAPWSALSFVYLHPAGPAAPAAGDFLFGIANGAKGYDDWDIAAMAQCGVHLYRFNPHWARIQPEAGTWRWEWADRTLDQIEAHGGATQLILSGTARWAVAGTHDGKEGGAAPPRPAAWRDWVRAVVERYGRRTRHWELWNEPDIDFFDGTVEDYLAVLRIASEEIRRGAPGTQVMTGGFASIDHGKAKPGMIERVLREAHSAFDVLAYHRHGDFPRFAEEIDHRIAPLLRGCLPAPVPWYFTETAMDTRHGECFQAATLVAKLVFAWSRGAIAYNWFNITDMVGPDEADKAGFTYGLCTRDRRPKAAYAAYTTLISQLRGLRHQGELVREPGLQVHAFAGLGRQVLVAWSDTDRVLAAPLVVASDATGAQAVDLMGNATPMPIIDGRILVPIGATPGYTVLTGATRLPICNDRLLAVDGTCDLLPGQVTPIVLRLRNPARQPMTCTLTWQPPERLGRTQVQEIALPPDGTATARLPLESLPETAGSFGTLLLGRLSYRLAAVGMPVVAQGAVALPLRVAGVNVTGMRFAKAPTFLIEDRDQVVNRNEHDPHSMHLLWQGRQDLSARVWLARAATGLAITVTVRDQRQQDCRTRKLTDGDRLTIAWAAAEGTGAVQRLVLGRVGGAWTTLPADRGAQVAATMQQDKGSCTYALTIPRELCGGAGGLRLNVRCDDDDGQGYKGWMALVPDPENGAAAIGTWPLVLLP